MSDLTALERRVLDALLVGDGPLVATLRAQAATAQATDRTGNPAGFWTDLKVDRALPPVSLELRREDGIGIVGRLPDSDVEVGFNLFVMDGYLQTLEGFTYTGKWPADESRLVLSLEGPGSVIQDSRPPSASRSTPPG